MKGFTLYLLRHAKSEKGGAALADIARPLSDRGRHEAAWVASLMAARGYQPARILCSSSQRTRETLAALVPVLTYPATIELTRRIYDASAEALLDLIHEQDDNVPSFMLIGHNPGFEQLARTLAGSGDGAALLSLRTTFPPAALTVITFDTADWRQISPGRGHLEAFETPAG